MPLAPRAGSFQQYILTAVFPYYLSHTVKFPCGKNQSTWRSFLLSESTIKFKLHGFVRLMDGKGNNYV